MEADDRPTDLSADRPDTEQVLLVEDDPLVRESTHEFLEALGYRVVEAADAREAIDLVETHPSRIDLVLCDMMLPDMRGDQLLHALRQIRPTLPALLTSGYNHLDFDGALADLDFFIQKPYDLTTLGKTLDGIFSNTS